MSPRQRKAINKSLPPGLRARDGYYSWTNPADGREHGLGRDRRLAIMEAIRANAHIAAKQPSLLERITGAVMTWDAWCDEFAKILAKRDSKANTQRTRKSQMKRLRALFPLEHPAGKVDTKMCAGALLELEEAGKARTAQAMRSLMIDCFDRQIARGIRKDNPAQVTDRISVKVRRARLPFDTFMALYRTTSIVWLRNAMALAIVSGQARESIAAARFTDVHDDAWWNERGKTGARIVLPLELRLECFGMSLGDVIRQCRSTAILSKFVIHQTERGRGLQLGRHLHVDQLTRAFTEELAKIGADWGEKFPPTFHEVRSLSGRMYKEEGRINPQELFGHKDPRTTAVYTDGRGEWVKVGIKK